MGIERGFVRVYTYIVVNPKERRTKKRNLPQGKSSCRPRTTSDPRETIIWKRSTVINYTVSNKFRLLSFLRKKEWRMEKTFLLLLLLILRLLFFLFSLVGELEEKSKHLLQINPDLITSDIRIEFLSEWSLFVSLFIYRSTRKWL